MRSSDNRNCRKINFLRNSADHKKNIPLFYSVQFLQGTVNLNYSHRYQDIEKSKGRDKCKAPLTFFYILLFPPMRTRHHRRGATTCPSIVTLVRLHPLVMPTKQLGELKNRPPWGKSPPPKTLGGELFLYWRLGGRKKSVPLHSTLNKSVSVGGNIPFFPLNTKNTE